MKTINKTKQRNKYFVTMFRRALIVAFLFFGSLFVLSSEHTPIISLIGFLGMGLAMLLAIYHSLMLEDID
jgi:polyferredoxin